jgi:hypothetical protein
MARSGHIFVSYSKQQHEYARTYADFLIGYGFDVWIDDRIEYGDNWWKVIEQAIKDCAAFSVVMTPEAEESKWVDREVGLADDLDKPLFPLLLSGENWSLFVRTQYVDVRDGALPPSDLVDRMTQVVRRSGTNGMPGRNVTTPAVSKTPAPLLKHSLMTEILPTPFEWCEIPRGFVTLIDVSGQGGTTGGKFEVQIFSIAKYPITNAQYQGFVDASDGYRDARWWNYSREAASWRMLRPQPTDAAFSGRDLPRTNVSWYDAIAFTRWLSYRTGRQITLPTERQWQRAAQGDDQREYPWGNTFDPTCCNVSGKKGKPTPVTHNTSGGSPFQVMDMAGNTNEWCLTKWNTDNIQLTGNEARILRGGCWLDSAAALCVTTRHYDKPSSERRTNGFRLVRYD